MDIPHQNFQNSTPNDKFFRQLTQSLPLSRRAILTALFNTITNMVVLPTPFHMCPWEILRAILAHVRTYPL